MKLLLLHGPAIETSRRKLQELKKQFNLDSVVVFDSEASAGQVVADFLTVPMFSEKRLIIWENPSEVFTLPTTNDQLPATMVLWFDREVDVKKWPGYEPLFFPEAKEVSVFPFLDFLAAKDQKAFLEMEKFKKAGFDIHYLLTMAFYLLRSLAVTPKNAPDFVRKKLARQRTRFSMEDVKNLYKDLLEIDFKIKSGLLEQSQAEFLLVNKFLK
ncbi:hypothetical protein A2867_00865 [Candidatus Daviesbacteria bacterium RIFCSPHIGHO2_01_FULL_40_11]|uniref:DNA polymerase III delta subunit-like C-terminal domain-containing protein n=1 Tax=Candidatus Daviesbacteria bacterium RIFCSPHIGHO2_01_FULL_40_11 TaxID=1797762 RepID=A0A1F5JLH9_9BACT|nr:MAG: hypothetical protein A2867_00865 [Candidatus Daviesbacteria bacterium RIFCSPHIGHO2_01_FULL_40_11]